MFTEMIQTLKEKFETPSDTAKREYERLLRELVKLPDAAEAEHDRITDLMDAPWYAMTEAAQVEMRWLSAQLQREREGQP
jgi:hypothetical protein